MKANTLFKFETIVWKLVFTFGVSFFSLNSAAEDAKCSHPTKSVVEQAKDWAKENCGEESDATLKAACIKRERKWYVTSCTGTADVAKTREQICDNVIEKFNEAKSEFNPACKAAGMGGGSLSCLQRAWQCNTCSGTFTREQKQYTKICENLALELETPENRATNIDGQVNGFDLVEMAQRVQTRRGTRTRKTTKMVSKDLYANCPGYSSAQLEMLEDRTDKHIDSVRDLQRDQVRQNTQLAESTNVMQKAQRDYEQLVQQQNNQLQNEFEAAKIKASEDSQKAQEDLTQISNQIAALATERSQAQNKYLDDLSALRVSCHQEALGRVQEEREERRAKQLAKSYSTNSINKLFGSTGKSARTKSQQRAEKYYGQCMKTGLVAEQRANLKRRFDFEVEAINIKHQALMQLQQTTIQRLEQVTQAQQQQLQMAQRSMQIEVENAQKNLQTAMQAAMTEQNAIRAELGIINMHLQDEEAKMGYYQDTLFLANQIANDRSIDPEDFDSALGKVNEVNRTAASVLSQCSCKKSCESFPNATEPDAGTSNYSRNSICDAAATAYQDSDPFFSCKGGRKDESNWGGKSKK